MSKLLPGENLVLKDHPHWVTIAGSVFLPAVLVIAVAILDLTLLSPNMQAGIYVPHLRTFLSLGVVALALIWLIAVWISWQSIVYTLTDQRIMIQTGVFSRQEKIIPIDRVQDCTTRQSVIGRMFGYGRVEVDAAGAQGAEILQYLPKPGEFRDQVFMQSEKRRGGGMPATPSGSPVPANPSGV
ncbi:MAG TPA: PH domain-containing protein [Candidatus Dormibacteraeota bacterium]|nr:PH domain-containing protein [Candidatus Dormibacteraeota bacterium]